MTSAMDCVRKAWLGELVGGGSNDKAVLGTLTHELVAGALSAATAALGQGAGQGQGQGQGLRGPHPGQQQQQGGLLDRQQLVAQVR